MRVYSQVQINSGMRSLLSLIKLAEIFPRENTCLHLWVGGFMLVHIIVCEWGGCAEYANVTASSLISDAVPHVILPRDYLASKRATRLLVYYADKLRRDAICHRACMRGAEFLA
jgi:hypothetical protein